jgi:hypothetical protein
MTEKQIDDLIDEWHTGEHSIKIHEFLGWTLEEYKIFVETGNHD